MLGPLELASSLLVDLRFWSDIVFYTFILAVLDGFRWLLSFISQSGSLNSVNVAVHSTPTFFAAFWKHMLLRKQRRGTAAAELSYAEGLELVREFLAFAATHTVEELQSFTGKDTPTPSWVEKSIVEIPAESLQASGELLRTHLETDDPGLKDVGGANWWTLRARPLFGEWLEMLRDAQKREAMQRAGKEPPTRVILYLHGGAHYFAGNGTHRYQIQRHARKLAARAFSVSYRLSPQYPFPCGLQDALAAYLFLIAPPEDSAEMPIHAHNIMLYGDSSGGALALSLMVVLRDAGLPMPGGCVLLSPWVDLTHSFPSVLANPLGDYIPQHGFHFRPSTSWPPIRGDPMVFESDGRKLVVKEQIQLYCSNSMISHPMVTLVNQGSLGGLPPMLVLGGSGELLADEILYIAHKAANPERYLPAEAILNRYPNQRKKISQYPPTKVQLQMFDGCCHVTTTLSFSTPAKFQYRSAANFSLWALQAARARVEREGREELDKMDLDQHHHDYATDADKEAPSPPQKYTPPRYRRPTRQSSVDSQKGSADGNAASLPQNTFFPSGNAAHNDSGYLSGQGDSEEPTHTTAEPLKMGTRPRKQSIIDSFKDAKSELSVVTDEDASAANRENEYLSDYSEDSESGDELEEDKAQARRMSLESTREQNDGLLDNESDVFRSGNAKSRIVTVTGTLPAFKDSIIRERVTADGHIRVMEPEEEVSALTMPRERVGTVSPEGPVKKWLEKRQEWDGRYRRDLIHHRKIKMKDRKMAQKAGFLSRELVNENPPLSAVAGMYSEKLAWEAVKGQDSSTAADGEKEPAGLGMMLWSKLSSKPDAAHQGKTALYELAKRGDMRLERQPSDGISISTPEIEKELQL